LQARWQPGSAAPKNDLVSSEGLDTTDTGRVQHREDLLGTSGLGLDPVAEGGVIRDLGPGQEHAQEFLDLSQTQTRRERDGGEPLNRGLIEEDPILGLAPVLGDRLTKSLILGPKLGDQGIRFGLLSESLLDFLGMFVDRLATAPGLVGWSGHGAMVAGEDGGGVADPSADR
jgi:hypothetical protein